MDISRLLNAAIQTGASNIHLVMSTVHTADAAETINRLVAAFPTRQQRQVRLKLANVLRAVVSQRLIPRGDGRGRSAAVEVLVNTPFIQDCIRNPDRTTEIATAIASGTSQYGMQTFDQSIYDLFVNGDITYEMALRWASNPDKLSLRIQGVTSTTDAARDEMAAAPSSIRRDDA